MKHTLYASLAVLALAWGAPALAAHDHDPSGGDDNKPRKEHSNNAGTGTTGGDNWRGRTGGDNGGSDWRDKVRTGDTGRTGDNAGSDWRDKTTGGDSGRHGHKGDNGGSDWRDRVTTGGDNGGRDRNRWRSGDNNGGDNNWRDRDHRTGDNDRWRDRDRDRNWGDRDRDWRDRDRDRDWRDHDRDRGWRWSWNNWSGKWNNWGHRREHGSWYWSFRRAFYAPHRYHWREYYRPNGWYYRRWTYGEFLPALFFTQDNWIDSYYDFGLSDPPEGTTWVRYGNDAILVDVDTGEIIQVVYGIFY